MNTPKAILLDLILVSILFIIVSVFSNPNPIKGGLADSLCVFGISLCIITILTLFLNSWSHSITCIVISVILMSIGAILEQNKPPMVEPSDEQIGQCAQAEWILRLQYRDQYGITSYKDRIFVGSTEKASVALQNAVQEWDKNHPKNTVQSNEKLLHYIPLDYAKKNRYPTTYSTRYQ